MRSERRPSIRPIPLTPEQEAWQREQIRRAEVRRNLLVPIHVMWTSNVLDDAARHAQAGVVDALMASGQERDLAIIGSETIVPGDFENADWYVQRAYTSQSLRRNVGFGPQLDTSQFGRLFTTEPLQQNPHWDVLIVNYDLNARVNGEFINFVFGETNPGFPYSVQSIRRIEEATKDRGLNLAMIRNILRHEVGHMFGLVRRAEAVESLGSHCPNVCSMKQTLSIRELIENTIAVENQKQHFCNNCMAELAQKKDKFEPLPPPTAASV
ncbi:MAG: hypothetical protein COU25_03075 [Candidatus Levybacteria bacterium CG10_big_fil_rev_8_21_14_0_10_35_13]|nr:MAG: hypothetical protein COU25_03075 [Candidatus Levybacteria bacterium CG10_big_fil_rev_8_21_14_0_10_35_13]